ncbi:hypothetical protein BDR06DRAFT_1044271 [Suillus hirtellus]|nr:hypothetical protein BDR06DRAFT_1044271 [Suillus hirtellus]
MWATAQGLKGKKSTSSGQMELAKTDKEVMQMLTRVVEFPALKFPHNDNDPFCIFELPRNILVKYCNARDWLVLYIPRATNLVNSTTAHTYDMRTRTYLQPIFAYQTLQRFLKINAPRLEQLRTRTEIEIERCPPVPPDTPFVELINIGLKDQCHAPTVLDAVLAEIGRQTIFPVVLAVDDFQALYCKSHIIFGYQIVLFFLMLRLLLEHACGQKSFNQNQARDESCLSVPEASSVFELWMKDRAVPSKPNDELFLAKYTEASGNARAFVWKELLSSVSA